MNPLTFVPVRMMFFLYYTEPMYIPFNSLSCAISFSVTFFLSKILWQEPKNSNTVSNLSAISSVFGNNAGCLKRATSIGARHRILMLLG